jgi:site-specific DNA-methyltransferase (adenine-specific)
MRLPLDQVLEGDCLPWLDSLPENSVDLIFADPPYNLQLRQELWRPNLTRVAAVTDAWDQFDNFESYDQFCRRWLVACRRVLKDTGTLWVIGSYHNIYRLGALLQDLGYWILNDVVWIKTNPMPNFRGVRFANAHETLLWAAKSRESSYTFNHQGMKRLNDGKQMRSDWVLPICSGPERLKIDGKKAHSTQKPLALLYRVILSATEPGDVVLDPFFGTGTTGVAARLLHRHWIGIEKEPDYVRLARTRVAQTLVEDFQPEVFEVRSQRRIARRVPFGRLLEAGLLRPGQALYFQADRAKIARVKPDGFLRMGEMEGSIHQVARKLVGGSPCNGWDIWYYESDSGNLLAIDELRQAFRQNRA